MSKWVTKLINIIHQWHNCKKGITQLVLTSQRRQTGAIFLRISWNIISEMVFIFCFLNKLFLEGEGDGMRRWITTWIGTAFQVTSAICITLPSFGIVKYIINLQYSWFFKTVWFPEGCVLAVTGVLLGKFRKHSWRLHELCESLYDSHWRQIPPKQHDDNSN